MVFLLLVRDLVSVNFFVSVKMPVVVGCVTVNILVVVVATD